MIPNVFTPLDHQRDRINAALYAVLHSETFRRAKRLRQLLEYLVAETLAGRGERLKQFNIAVEAFGNDGDFQPEIQTSVRTEAWRLRSRLEFYYQTEGISNEVRISLPKGGFVPSFHFEGKSSEPIVNRLLSRAEPAARLLILPFSGLNMTDKDVVTAFHEEISSYLASLPSVAVLSHSAIGESAQLPIDLPNVVRALRASHVMEGSLFREARTYRLNLRIVDSSRGVTVWSRRHEEQVDDMIAFQRHVAADVAASVQSWLSLMPATVSMEDEMAPRYVWRDNVLLGEYLRGAIRDRTASEQVALGLGRLTSGQTHEAAVMFSQAILSSPVDGLPHTAMGLGHLQSGRLEDAYRAAERGVELAPKSAFAHSSLAAVCMHMRDFDGAIMFAQRAIALAPEFDAAKLLLGDCLLYAGFHKTAIAQLQEACLLMDEHPAALAHLGYAYAKSGQESEARQLLTILQNRRDGAEGPNPAAMTLIHAGLEDVEQAFKWLDRALKSRTQVQELLLLSSPAYDGLRSYPDFNSLAGRLNAR